MEKQIGNFSDLMPFAPEFSYEPGTEQARLWFAVLNRNMMKGYQFYRQYPICQYIVDFICPKLNLIIEIDGSAQMLKAKSVNKKRDDLERLGYRVLIFTETEVAHHLDEVIAHISAAVLSAVKN